MKKWLLVFVFVLTQSLAMAEGISVEDQKDYQILDQFFKMGVGEEEYGYVLEGLKPISIRNYYPIESMPPYKDIHYFQKQLTNVLLVKEAINVWKKLCSKQKKFALKAVPLTTSNATGWEVQFINVEKLKEVIGENIDLFRYVLGPKIQAEELTNRIAYSNEDFDSIIRHDLVLTGIVLGYGTHNSVIGGRFETISARTISKDCAPFLPKSQLMLSNKEHSMNVFTPQAYGTCYLEFAGGDDSLFQGDLQPLQPSAGFLTIEEEVMAIDAMSEPHPSELMIRPSFVFSAYKGGPSNKLFFDRLKQTQKQINALLKRSNFLETILKKISGKKPIIICKKPDSKNYKQHTDFTVREWTHILNNIADQFEDREQQLAFFESYSQSDEVSKVPPRMVGASKAMLVGLRKALFNLAAANGYFETISKDDSLKSIVLKRVYVKTIQPGQGKELTGSGLARIGYVIEDLEGNILFANADTWLDLSQTIAGFTYGVQGMRIGEKRHLYIHPAYGYGALTTLPPCSGLVVKAHLIDLDEKRSDWLPPLTELDMSWIQDPTLMADIESSLQQQPRYLGFLYRSLLGQIEGLDQSEIAAELNAHTVGKISPKHSAP